MTHTTFYHPRLTAQMANDLLWMKGTVGSFLIRKSQRNRHNYALCCLTETGPVHFTITKSNDGLRIGDFRHTFSSLSQMVKYLVDENGRDLRVNNVDLKLKQSIPSTEPTNERWFHGFITKKEANEVLLQNQSDEDNVFLVRRASRDAEYVLCVAVNGTVERIPIFCRNSAYFICEDTKFGTLADLVNNYVDKTLVTSEGKHIKIGYPVNTTQLEAANIAARIAKLQHQYGCNGETGFTEEYEGLGAYEFSYPCNTGRTPANILKNRYKNILPYDYSRVVLRKESKEDTDYINANYIQIDDQRWIGTQGCIQGTEADFWRMVWQQNSRIIVMMARLFEAVRAKCEKYWSRERIAFGNISIETVNKKKKRRLRYTTTQSDERKRVQRCVSVPFQELA